MEGPRVRLVFKGGQMLSKYQKSQGLKRSWLLLKPQHRTISDLSSYLLHTFDLSVSCPHGLLLSMDDFVLPPFESITLLKDNDIICLRKKSLSSSFKIAENLVEGVKTVGKKHLHNIEQPLANGKFEKESGSFQSDPVKEEDTLPEVNSFGENVVHNKQKPQKNNDLPSDRVQKDGQGREDLRKIPEKIKKGPSRNARRKKAKRKWMQEMAKIRKKRPSTDWSNWKQECTNTREQGICVPSVNYKQASISTKGNKMVDLWEQFSEALNTEDAEVRRESCWNRGSSTWGSWPLRPLKCRAL